ncbi:hypothetical protein [Alkalilimnicola sp. S0819]|uniref:hypothetical protein n=2 Tax=Alkalilimnicola sp. S0819 TaxID=2613922 RepID=UPI001D05A850|nr:hypothetical protein [Alkalilimnicola sp. S0819]
MSVGMSASTTRTFSDDDRRAYLALSGASGDDREGAKHRVPEALIGGMFSYILGTELPGFGTNYLKQRMEYRQPAFYGEALTATVTITRLREDKNLVNLETVCRNAAGDMLVTGEALVLAKDVAPR